MVQAVDFLWYCLGISSVLVASAGAVRIVRPATAGTKAKETPPAQKWEPISDPADDLHGRLQTFQSTRFGAPIVQRQLDPSAGPPLRSPLSSLPRPPLRPLTKVPPPPLRKQPAVRTDDKVVQIPLKMKKAPQEPPKEGA